MAGNDIQTVLLLHCDGTVGTTTFTDDSTGGTTHTVTANGDADIVAGGEFDEACGLDGTGDYLAIPSGSGDFDYGTGDYCIDMWIYPTSVASPSARFFGYFTSGTENTFIGFDGANGLWYIYEVGGVTYINFSQGDLVGWTANTWHHIALTRTGLDINMFLDGVHIGSQTTASLFSASVDRVDIGRYATGSYLDGRLDEIRVSKGTDRINDPDDPMYISSGLPADGFTPPTAAYTAPFDFTSMAPARLFQELNATSMTPAKLANTLDFTSMTTGRLRGSGSPAYFFDLRDSVDAQEDTNTGAPPTLVFTDVFTGVSNGMHTIYARSVETFKNLEDTLNETFVTFRLTSGLLDPLEPNEVTSLDTDLIPSAFVVLTWQYSTLNQEIAPTSFEVYIDAAFDSSAPFVSGTSSYSVTLGPLTETLKTFKVTSKAGATETTGVTVQDTPDATPPNDVPFQFEVS